MLGVTVFLFIYLFFDENLQMGPLKVLMKNVEKDMLC